MNVLSEDTDKSIACSIVLSKLDYCNSLLYSAPKATVDKLQRAQNVLARVVTLSGSRSSARPLLQQLLLPVRERINYKLALLAYRSPRLPSTCVLYCSHTTTSDH